MKATGIVRRIDDLGRVVIPKEIRRTLRIREGEPLEIYTEKDGSVIFRKYSPMGDLQEVAAQLCDAIAAGTGRIVAVSDRDGMIASAGGHRRELADKSVSESLDKMMTERKPYQHQSGGSRLQAVADSDKYFIETGVPILSQGDLIGCIMLLATEESHGPVDGELVLLRSAAEFLGRQMDP